jgi:hypothetical protein
MISSAKGDPTVSVVLEDGDNAVIFDFDRSRAARYLAQLVFGQLDLAFLGRLDRRIEFGLDCFDFSVLAMIIS